MYPCKTESPDNGMREACAAEAKSPPINMHNMEKRTVDLKNTKRRLADLLFADNELSILPLLGALPQGLAILQFSKQ